MEELEALSVVQKALQIHMQVKVQEIEEGDDNCAPEDTIGRPDHHDLIAQGVVEVQLAQDPAGSLASFLWIFIWSFHLLLQYTVNIVKAICYVVMIGWT